MQYYFQLQFRMLVRRIRDAGLNPLLFFPLALAGFVGLSHLLFQRSPYAGYLMSLMALMAMLPLTEQQRNQFLSSCFPHPTYHQIRLFENLLVALPFLLVLLIKAALLPVLLMLIGTAGAAFLKLRSYEGKVIPTPFYRQPFEFIKGFRQSVGLIAAAYVLTGIGIAVGNDNLCLFAIGVLFLIQCTFYFQPEPDLWVWIYPLKPAGFLKIKILTSIQQSIVLTTLPVILTLLFSTMAWWVLLLLVLSGISFLIVIILAKYAAFPNEIQLPQAIVLAACVWFPPLLLLTIPYFYIHAVQRLNRLLI